MTKKFPRGWSVRLENGLFCLYKDGRPDSKFTDKKAAIRLAEIFSGRRPGESGRPAARKKK